VVIICPAAPDAGRRKLKNRGRVGNFHKTHLIKKERMTQYQIQPEATDGKIRLSVTENAANSATCRVFIWDLNHVSHELTKPAGETVPWDYQLPNLAESYKGWVVDCRGIVSDANAPIEPGDMYDLNLTASQAKTSANDQDHDYFGTTSPIPVRLTIWLT
jgi:hypothetical protein